jgi:uncharacterized protein YjbJ (UPF0337 family)
VSDEDHPDVTREELFETLAGKAKEKAGEVLGNDQLARRGRRQLAEVEAEAEAAEEAHLDT